MPFSFDNILITVDDSDHSEIAVSKAMRLYEGPTSSFKLVYLKKKQILGGLLGLNSGVHNENIKASELLVALKHSIINLNRNIRVSTEILENTDLQKGLAELALLFKSDLIILGSCTRFFPFPFNDCIKPSGLSATTKIPVLTVKPGGLAEDIKTIVLPIEEDDYHKKLEMTLALSKKFRLSIHLVTFVEKEYNSMNGLASTFIEAFDWLKKNLHCSVKYNFLKGSNKSKALVDYCNYVGADLLLQGSVNDYVTKEIGDFFPKDSKTQVLTI